MPQFRKRLILKIETTSFSRLPEQRTSTFPSKARCAPWSFICSHSTFRILSGLLLCMRAKRHLEDGSIQRRIRQQMNRVDSNREQECKMTGRVERVQGALMNRTFLCLFALCVACFPLAT